MEWHICSSSLFGERFALRQAHVQLKFITVAQAAAVAIPIISSYATERLAGGAAPSTRAADGGGAAPQQPPSRCGVAWQAALAAVGAASWLVWQQFDVLRLFLRRSGTGGRGFSPSGLFSSWRSQNSWLSSAAKTLMAWATQPWLTAVSAFLLMCPLLHRNANARLFVSAAGARPYGMCFGVHAFTNWTSDSIRTT